MKATERESVVHRRGSNFQTIDTLDPAGELAALSLEYYVAQ